MTVRIEMTNTMPWTIGKSCFWMPVHSSWPMPGHAKTFSTTTAPPMSHGSDRKKVTVTGISALRRTWRTRTLSRSRPLAVAVLT